MQGRNKMAAELNFFVEFHHQILEENDSLNSAFSSLFFHYLWQAWPSYLNPKSLLPHQKVASNNMSTLEQTFFLHQKKLFNLIFPQTFQSTFIQAVLF